MCAEKMPACDTKLRDRYWAPVVLVVLFLAFASQNANASDWSVYSSDNLTIYTDAKDKKARKLLRDFEVFRSAVIAVTGIENRPENSRMIILLYARTGTYRKIAPRNSSGFFLNSISGPRLVNGPGGRAKYDLEILFHEYVHYLMNEHSLIAYPRWYAEGFAELLGATTIRGGAAVVGTVPAAAEYSLRTENVLRIEDLLASERSPRKVGLERRFYSTAWLLTHFLQIGSLIDDTDLKQQTSDYLKRVHDGEDVVGAFNDSFRMNPRDMDKALARYRKNRRLTVVELSIGEYEGEIQRRQLDENEKAFLLADTAWSAGEQDVALEYLDDIRRDAVNAARPLSLLAVLQNHARDTEAARANAASALALAPNDSRVLTNLCHLEYDLFNVASEKGEIDRDTLLQSIAYGQKAVELDPGNREAYHYLHLAYIAADMDTKAANALMSAFQIAPSSIRINLAVGLFTFERGHYDLARPFLERVRAWSHSAEQRANVEELLRLIDNTPGAE